ncbi:hypothetical protein HDF15_001927 [Granulicella mallensis]|uniref:Uncharacterized protein n=1 Tax=Granulicella mallensis TaxID=940614 RepID=A0A7W7ZPX3_9BACT|nr:hypothetical protein [Granulicella mallensis]
MSSIFRANGPFHTSLRQSESKSTRDSVLAQGATPQVSAGLEVEGCKPDS